MNTQELFNDFHLKSKEEINELAKKFVEADLFVKFPKLKEISSIIITGSVAHDAYDKESDIDLAVVFHNEEDCIAYKALLMSEFKGENFKSKKPPIELHGQNITCIGKIAEELESWNKDWLLGEMKDALVVYDPTQKIQELKLKYAWYPDEIFKDKIRGLFAEATFLLFDRYRVAMNRGRLYYLELTKLKIMGQLMIVLVMLNQKYPKSNKHLECDIENIENLSIEIKKLIDDILREKRAEKEYDLLCLFRTKIENMLIERTIIKEETEDYWIGFRGKHKVELES